MQHIIHILNRFVESTILKNIIDDGNLQLTAVRLDGFGIQDLLGCLSPSDRRADLVAGLERGHKNAEAEVPIGPGNL